MLQSKFTIRDPNYKERVINSFNEQQFMKHINCELKVVTPGFCELLLPYSKDLTQQNEYFHAGIVATLGDNACGYAAFSLMEADASVLTVEYKINLIAPAKGDFIIAKGTVTKSGKTLSVCTAEIFSKEQDKLKLCALMQATIMQLKK